MTEKKTLNERFKNIMGMKLERTMIIAEGCEKCDFRYSRKGSISGIRHLDNEIYKTK